jgi:hypothetical protein
MSGRQIRATHWSGSDSQSVKLPENMQLSPLPFSARPIVALIFWGSFASWVLPEIIAWRVMRSPDCSHASDRGSLKLIALLWWFGIAIDFLLSLLVPQTASGSA